MFPINFNFPYRKKDGSLITMEKALDGAGSDLDLIDLDDVSITSPADGDGLIYDNTAHKWKNIPIISRILALFNAWQKNGAYNLQPIDVKTQVVNATTFTIDSDGIKTQGAPSATVYFQYSESVYRAGKYRFCGCPTGGSDSTYRMLFRVYSGADSSTPSTDYYDTGSGLELTLTTNQLIKGFIHLSGGASGYDGTLKQFKPMITTDLNATYDDYVPYAMTNRELTEDVTPEQVRHETLNDTNFGGDIYVHQVGRIVYVEGDIQIKTAIAYNTTVISSVPQALSTACGMCVGGDGSYKGRLGISGTNLIASSNLTTGYVHIAMSYLAK